MAAKASDELCAHLIRLNGPQAGRRHLIKGRILRIGRSPENDLLPDGDNAGIVSGRHLEIRREEGEYLLRDLDSTNGTFVDGEKVESATLEPGMVISLGAQGPDFQFQIETIQSPALPKTQIVSSSILETSESRSPGQEGFLQEAVERARSMRRGGQSGQTLMIMRQALDQAVSRSARKFKIVIAGLLLILVVVTGWAVVRINGLEEEMEGVDDQIGKIESDLQNTNDPKKVQALLDSLNRYQERALAIEKNVLYRIGAASQEQDFIEKEIRRLMSELGAEQYSIPPEFRQQVELQINRFKGPDRRNVERALIDHRQDLERIRSMLTQQKLPPDLAYLVLVESAFKLKSTSPAGAAGPWQFLPATARAYGLTVNGQVDERFDVEKSTAAACRYIRHLILEFGSGSSVMLALAAYNFGPARIKRVIRRVEDPIRQRSFWYLYRTRSLPRETREYIPKVVAAILIGRNRDYFGFSA